MTDPTPPDTFIDARYDSVVRIIKTITEQSMGIRANVSPDDNIYKGEAKTLAFTCYVQGSTAAEIRAGTAARQDITGWSLEWDLSMYEDEDPLLRKIDDDSGIIITDALQGECEVYLLAAETLDMVPGTYWHTLWRDDAGSESVLSNGTFALLDPVEQLV
jgi:hypothetical protein